MIGIYSAILALLTLLKPKVQPILGSAKDLYEAASGDIVFSSLHLNPFHYRGGLGLGHRYDIWGRVVDFSGCGGCGGKYVQGNELN